MAILVFSLLLAGGVSWAADCEAGFTDTINVKVIDYKYRPIEGAAVNVTYQRDQSTGKGYVTTTTVYTDAEGKASQTIRNIEVSQSKVKCDVTISAKYDGEVVEREITANSHSAEIQVRFEEAYLLNLKIVDRYGQPIANTEVRINEMYKTTSGSGTLAVIVNSGTIDVAVPYLGGVLAEQIELEEDTTYTITAKVYSLLVNVVDDAGDPLVAQIFVEEDEYYDTGVSIEEIALQSPYVKVVYGSLEKEVEANLAASGEYTVSFDLTPPEIRNVEVERTEEDLKILFYAHDPNVYATGVDLDETTVTYTIGGVTHTAVPYVESGSYVVELPVPPENTLLRFTITSHDFEGNMNTVNGQYLVTPETEEPEPEPEENGGEPIVEEEQPSEWEIDSTLLLGLGVVVVVVLAYAVISYVRGLSEEE